MKLHPSVALIFSLLIALVVVFVVDPLDPSTLSTPFCLGLILMGLSFHQRPRVVVTVTLAYMALAFYAMVHFLEFAPIPSPHPYFWFFQRFGLFLIVCTMSIYLSYYREYTERHISYIQNILGKLPVPVVVSDAGGSITYANDALCAFFSQPAPDLIGKRYIDLFMANIQEAKATRYYLELFGKQTSTAQEVELKTSVKSQATNASLTCLGVGDHRNMITVLQLN